MAASVTFWGVRGSIPTPVAENLGFGGNTACIEIRSGGQILILDAGTGIRHCGGRLLAENGHAPREISLAFSHFHWDHVQGIPYFIPLFKSDFRLKILSGGPAESTRARLQGVMNAPYFPVDWSQSASSKEYLHVPGAGLADGAFHLRPVQLHHPQGATGYRIETDSGTILYASDFEHGNSQMDAQLLEAARNVDLLIYDAQYTPEEYEAGKQGWGHSTWFEAVRLAQASRAAKLVLFHHDPGHNDAAMEELQAKARILFPETDVAREGTSWALAKA